MARITITKENTLKPAEFMTLLEQLEERSSEIDNLLDLLRQLVAFEQTYDMASDIFYARFMRGEMGDDLPFIKWAGRYELYLEARQAIDQQVNETTVSV